MKYLHLYLTFPQYVVKVSFLPVLLCCFGTLPGTAVRAQSNFSFEKVFYVPYKGDWNNPTVNPLSNKLYITHGNQVTILNKYTGDSIGTIANTPGVKSVALAPKFGKGYATNSSANTVTVFDLKSDRFVKEIPVGVTPFHVMFEAFSNKIIVSNAKGGNLTVIDPRLDKVETNIPLNGNKITGMVSDGNGNLFVHLADKREVVWLNLSTYEVLMHWSLGPGKSPSGMTIDTRHQRLFSVCNKLLVVFDVSSAKIVDTLTIGLNSNGIVYNPSTRLIFVANGDGTLSVINQLSPNEYKLVKNIPTKKGSNLLAFDEMTSTLFVPGADQFVPSKSSAKQTISSSPRWIPISFQVMVLDML